MQGLKNTINFIIENWSNIIILACLIYGIILRVKKFHKLSEEEKVDAALTIVNKQLLKWMSDAELQWSDIKKSGELKKSEVITKIYDEFPNLKEFVDQDKLLQTISNMIDENMAQLNKVLVEKLDK